MFSLSSYNRNDMRFYLNVPYSRKDDAKSAGYKWDPEQKKWYMKIDKDYVDFFIDNDFNDNSFKNLLHKCLTRKPRDYPIVGGMWNGSSDYKKEELWEHIIDIVKNTARVEIV